MGVLTVGVCIAGAIGAGRCAGAAPVEKRAGAASELVSLTTDVMSREPAVPLPGSRTVSIR
jgi:hypothetical protein